MREEREKDELDGLLNHVVSVPSRDGDEGDGLGVVSDLEKERRKGSEVRIRKRTRRGRRTRATKESDEPS